MHFDLKKLIVCLLCFFFVDVVNAETYGDTDILCGNDYIKKLKNVANSIKTNYEYDEKNYYYNVYLSGVDSKFKIIVDDDVYYDSVNGEVVFNHEAGEVKIEVYSTSCEETVYNFSLKLPFKNGFYNTDDCKKLDKYNLEVCKEWVDEPIEEEEFEEVVSEYADDSEDVNFDDDNKTLYILVIFCVIIAFALLLIRYKRRSILK